MHLIIFKYFENSKNIIRKSKLINTNYHLDQITEIGKINSSYYCFNNSLNCITCKQNTLVIEIEIYNYNIVTSLIDICDIILITYALLIY